MPSKFPVVPDIGLKVHKTVPAEVDAFGRHWVYEAQNQSAANIARSCLMYYKAMWTAFIPPINKEDVVLDIGAHMGFFCIPVSSQVKQVIAYEPAPANYTLLRRNIKRNRVTNISAFNMAVGDTDGTVTLNLGVQGTTGHSVARRKRGGVSIPIGCVSIHRVIEEYNPTVLKMDAEGIEWDILTDSIVSMFDNIRIMIVEMHDVKHHNLAAVVFWLSKHGFATEQRSDNWFTRITAYK
jgi:FkbM family methyltransferase